MEPTVVTEAVATVLPIVSPTLVLTVIGGILLTALVGVLKGPLKKFNPQYVVLVIGLVFGVLYYFFHTLVPTAMQASLVEFAVYSLTIGVSIYELIWKNVKKLLKK